MEHCSEVVLQIETSVVAHLLELVDECDKNKDGKIDFGEWETMGERFSSSGYGYTFDSSFLTNRLNSFENQTSDSDGWVSTGKGTVPKVHF